MAKVVLEGIKKIYPGNVTAVDNFNMEIEDKEFIVLVGPSGCGKTTTLRMIAGLEEISEGTLYIGNTLVNDIPPKDRDIAMVFQNYALYPHMSVYDNMAFGLKLRKMPKEEIRDKIMNAAKILEIEHLLDRKPKALSGGQRQRVALGRAIVRNPQVFLMDEPLSNLDAKLRVQMRTEISKLHQNLQTTFIYVTHDQTEAMTMGTRIVIMKDGIIQQIDTPQNAYTHPANLFVAGFIGSPQMNIFTAMVIEMDGEIYLQLEEGPAFKLPPEKALLLKEQGFLNTPVYMGIRPECIQKYEEENFSLHGTSFDITIEVREMLGAETHLNATLCHRPFVARITSITEDRVGDSVKLMLDGNKIHVFDKETEKTIF